MNLVCLTTKQDHPNTVSHAGKLKKEKTESIQEKINDKIERKNKETENNVKINERADIRLALT